MSQYPPTVAIAAATKATGIEREKFTLKDWTLNGKHAIFNLVDESGQEHTVEGTVTPPAPRAGGMMLGGEKWDMKVQSPKEGEPNG